jgi:hypothetical protein
VGVFLPYPPRLFGRGADGMRVGNMMARSGDTPR